MRTEAINAVLSGDEVGTYIVHWRDGRSTLVASVGYLGTEVTIGIPPEVAEWWQAQRSIRSRS